MSTALVKIASFLTPDLRLSRPIMGAIDPGARFGIISKVIVRLWKIGNICRIRPVSVYHGAAV